MIPCIDVSKYQRDINWQMVKDAGIQHAVIRAGDFMTVDPYCIRNKQACKAIDLSYDVYVFVRAHYFSASIAKTYASYMKDSPNSRLWLDLEWGSQTPRNPNEFATWLIDLVKELNLLGVNRLGIYTSSVYWNTFIGKDADILFNDLPVWLARYPFDRKTPPIPTDWEDWVSPQKTKSQPTLPRGCKDWVMWQFSSAGSIPGIVGNVDCNVLKVLIPSTPPISASVPITPVVEQKVIIPPLLPPMPPVVVVPEVVPVIATKLGSFNPPLVMEPIVFVFSDPLLGVWFLAASGAVYAFAGAPYAGGANTLSDFVGHTASEIRPSVFPSKVYDIIDSDGNVYSFPI